MKRLKIKIKSQKQLIYTLIVIVSIASSIGIMIAGISTGLFTSKQKTVEYTNVITFCFNVEDNDNFTVADSNMSFYNMSTTLHVSSMNFSSFPDIADFNTDNSYIQILSNTTFNMSIYSFYIVSKNDTSTYCFYYIFNQTIEVSGVIDVYISLYFVNNEMYIESRVDNGTSINVIDSSDIYMCEYILLYNATTTDNNV